MWIIVEGGTWPTLQVCHITCMYADNSLMLLIFLHFKVSVSFWTAQNIVYRPTLTVLSPRSVGNPQLLKFSKYM